MVKKTEIGTSVVRVGKQNRTAHFSLLGIGIFCGTILAGFQGAVQFFAWNTGYQAALGEPWVRIGRVWVYPTWCWLKWSILWGGTGGRAGDLVLAMQLIAVGGVAGALGFGYWFYYKRSMKREHVEDLHGSARFADATDVLRMELAHPKGEAGRGAYVGAFEFGPNDIRFLRYDGDGHLGAGAPTRSGKGVGLVLPTLLTEPRSVFVNDVKKENWWLTSGFRHRAGSLCIAFDATHGTVRSIDGKKVEQNTCQWNVLQEIRLWTEMDTMDAQNIAAAIADPKAEGMDDHWVSTSYELFTGLFLHMCYAERDKSLRGAATYLSDPAWTQPEQMFDRMLMACHDPDGRMGWTDSAGNPTRTHPVIASAAQAMLNKEERERNSVLSTAKTRLSLFMEPIVGRNTGETDFCVRDLMQHEKPVSLYLIVPPSDKERLRPLIRLFVTFAMRRLTEEMRFEDGAQARGYVHQLLMLIDELASLRKLDCIQDGLAFVAGYGIQLYLIFQDTVQVKEAYGDKESVLAGLHVKVFYAPNKIETAEEISKMTGQTTVSKQDVSFSGSRNAVMLNQVSVSEHQVERPLMTPDEVRRLPRDEALVFVTGEPVIRARKVRYYEIPELVRRARMSPPARIGYSWWDEEVKQTVKNWMMVSVERGAEGQLAVWINPYKEYPRVKVVVKQLVLATGELLEVACRLTADGAAWEGPLDLDRIEYGVVPAAGTPFDVREAFELHLELAEPPSGVVVTETGYFDALSTYEAEARERAREHYARDKNAKVSFDRVGPHMVCHGEVVLETERCIVLERTEEILSVHRKELLDGEWESGRKVVIRYGARRGKVNVR